MKFSSTIQSHIRQKVWQALYTTDSQYASSISRPLNMVWNEVYIQLYKQLERDTFYVIFDQVTKDYNKCRRSIKD